MIIFLLSIPRQDSKQFFRSVRVLIHTIITGDQTFDNVMSHFLRVEDSHRHRGIIYDDDVPPPMPGMPAPRYSMDRWRLVKKLDQLQISLRPVTPCYVLFSHNMMMTSSNARLGFDLRCIMRGSNPRLKLRTVSPGMFCVFLRRFLANAAESGQSDYMRHMMYIFAQFYGLDPIMLLNVLRKI